MGQVALTSVDGILIDFNLSLASLQFCCEQHSECFLLTFHIM